MGLHLLTCPYCGYVNKNQSEEIDYDREYKIKCSGCGEVFLCEFEVLVTTSEIVD